MSPESSGKSPPVCTSSIKNTNIFPNPMWLEWAKLHAISGNMPWATLSLIYSCLSKLLRLQSYRSLPFKSNIIVTECFLWALKVCSWSRKWATTTESTIYGWILNIINNAGILHANVPEASALDNQHMVFLHTFALKHLQHSSQL